MPVEFGRAGAVKAHPLGQLDHETKLLGIAVEELLKGNVSKGVSFASAGM